MSISRYQCKKCDHEWTGNDFIAVCPDCQSAKIRKITSLAPWKYAVGAVLVLSAAVILLLVSWGKKAGAEGSTYVVHASQVDDYVQVELERYFESGGQLQHERLDADALQTSLDHLQFKNQNGGRIAFLDGNRIYPCTNGDVLLSWQNSEAYPLKNQDDTLKLIQFSLSGKKPNPKANCGDTLVFKILMVKPVADSKIEVTTNLDVNAPVLFSFSGRPGPYQRSNIFQIHGDYYVADVWAYLEGNDPMEVPPVFWNLNGDKIYPIKKEDVKPIEKQKIEQEFLLLANAFGLAPDRDAAGPFNQFLAQNAVDPQVLLNGELLEEGIAELFNRLRTDFLNDGKHFRIKPGSVVVSEKGKVTSFEFVEQVTG